MRSRERTRSSRPSPPRRRARPGSGLALTTAAGRAGQLGLPRGRYTGGARRPARRHRAGGHHADPPGRLRAGRRTARGHPGPPAGAPGGRPGVRGDRRTPVPVAEPDGARCRCPTAPTDLRRPVGVGRLPRRRRPALRGVDLSPRPGPPGGRGRAERGRQVDAGRRPRALPARRRRRRSPSTGCRSTGWPPTTCARVVGLVEQDAHLFDTTLAENLRVGAARRPTTSWPTVLARVGLADWLAGLPAGLATEVGPAGRPALGRPAPAGGGGPRPAGRLPRPGPRRAGRAPRPRGRRRR